MQRSVHALASTTFDLAVIGGGILGACIARDAALRGMSVALVERGDWGGATSSNTLRIVHGGLRYLQHGDLRRVRESIRERSIWLRIAPHLIDPLPVLVPASGWGLHSRLAFAAATTMNEVASWGRNRGVSADRILPRGRMVSRAECLSLVPELASVDSAGGMLFHDGLMYSSERLVLETVMGAAQAGAVVANYVEVEGPLRDQVGQLAGVVACDRRAGSASFDIRARFIINASGPGAAQLSTTLVAPSARPLPPIGYTLAINLGVDSTGHEVAFSLRGKSRQLFVVPWRGRTLIGTAHLPYDGDPQAFDPAHVDVDAFVAEVNTAWPTRTWSTRDVRCVYAGLVPGRVDAARTVRPDRHRWLVDHAVHGEPSLLTAASVKFTTARHVAEEAVDRIGAKMGIDARCRTHEVPLPGAPEGTVTELVADARRAHPRVAPAVLDHLVRTYGRGYDEVIRAGGNDRTNLEPVVPGGAVVPAQFVHAARNEMATTVNDIVLRRTELGAVGCDAPSARRVAELSLTNRHAS